MLEANIIKVLKKARKNRKITQEIAAEAIGTSSKTLYRVESLYVPISLNMFLALCELYQIAPEQIIIQAKNLSN